ncbi:MAG: UbiA family prenyltransferase [archaeon]
MEREIAKFGYNKGKLFALLELGRPWNAGILGLFAIIGFLLVKNAIEINVIYAFFSFVFLYMAGTTVNDIFGLETDKINISVRPLPSGRVTLKEAWAYSIFFYALGLSVSYFVGFYFMFWALAFCVLSFLYSMKPISLDSKWYSKSLVLAIVTVFVPFSGGASIISGKIIQEMAINYIGLAMSAFFLFIATTNDLKDMKGDAETGKKTLALLLGEKKTMQISAFGLSIFFLLTNYMLLNYIKYSLAFMAFCVIIWAILIRRYFITENNEMKFTKARFTVLAYVLGLIAMLL